jgi:hypothetical protein
MITLVTHYKELEPQAICSVPKRPLFLIIGLGEVTLLVIGILAWQQVHPLNGFSSEYVIAFLAGGGGLLLFDVVAAVIHTPKFTDSTTAGYESDLFFDVIEPTKKEGNTHYTVDLSKCCSLGDSDTRPHVYPVFKSREIQNFAATAGRSVVLYFDKENDFTINNVRAVGFTLNGPQSKPLRDCLPHIRSNAIQIHIPTV